MLLELGDSSEAAGEGQRQQEGEQDLHTRLSHPYLLQYLAVGPVSPLQRRLAAYFGVPVVVVVGGHAHLAEVAAVPCPGAAGGRLGRSITTIRPLASKV